MAKLMGLDYTIQYKKGRDNVVADALSRCMENGETTAIMEAIPEWYQEVASSYESNESVKEIFRATGVGS